MSDTTAKETPLTAEERALMERNRQKALLIREKKRNKLTTNDLKVLELKNNAKNSIDSGAGFFIEDDEQEVKKKLKVEPVKSSLPETTTCELCNKDFDESYLKKNFDYSVCDSCRDPKDKHTLITRTDAKNTYLLKDCDLDRREPPLRFISKKNPNHKFARNDMKLYLLLQVEKRALEVWGSEEKLIEEIESRRNKKVSRKDKEFKKNISKLRMEMQSSLYKRNLDAHTHEYGNEEYDDERSEYCKKCLTCGHELYYEKM